REIKILGQRIRDNQKIAFQTQALQLLREQLGLGSINGQIVDDDDAVLTGQLGEDRSHTGAEHLFVNLLCVVLLGRIRENPPAPTPQRAAIATGTSTTRTLLAPRLGGGMTDFGAILLLTVAGTSIRLISDDDLVHQRFVEIATEQHVRSLQLGGFLTLFVNNLEFHVAPLSLDCRTHDDVGTLGTRNGTLDQQQLAFSINADNRQPLQRALDITEMTGHTLARENTTRILCHTDGTRRIVRHR